MGRDIKSSPKLLNKDIIKYFAMLTMLLNHIATIFLRSGTLVCESFLAIGYFTAIVMIYFLVEGYYYTHSRKKYLSRLFVFAIISEIPYCLAFTKGRVIEFYGLNMLFTLCLCFLLIWGLTKTKNRVLKTIFTIAIIFISLFCDWAILAPIFTLLFVWARNSTFKTRMTFLISTLLFGIFNFVGGIGRFPVTTNFAYALLSIVGMGVAGICIAYFYNGKRAKKATTFSKWFFYIFYPGHLLILGIIRISLGL